MFFILAALLLALYAARHFGQKAALTQWAVHAARADGDACVPLAAPWSLQGTIRDDKGRIVSPVGKFVGRVAGDSMASYGMKKGQTFLADPISDPSAETIQSGDIVVVLAAAKKSNTGRRLRCVERIEGDKAIFKDGSDKPFQVRDLSMVVAKVTHVMA